MANEVLTLEIEKLIYGGKSLAKTNDGYPIFIDGGCPSDIAKIEIVKRNKSYGIGKIVEIEDDSIHRVKPFCPLHNVCGGCGLQHITYEEQLVQKENIVRETISKISGEDIKILSVKAPHNILHYRYKVQYPISQTKVSKKIIAGYYKKGTHEAVNIRYCPVQPKVIDEIIEFIRLKAFELNITGYDEKSHKGTLRHVIFRMSRSNKKILVILVLNETSVSKKVKELADALSENDSIVGVLANFNNKKTNVITGEKSELLCGEDFITEEINDIKYHVSAMSFFQVNPESAEIIFNTAKEMIENNTENPTILDAYSGVSAFGLQMKDIAKEVVCVEENKSSTDDAKINIKINNAGNVSVINNDASKTFEKFVREGKTFDVVLLDPPRKGCSKESLDYAAELSKNIIVYVSCNPSTLASDIKYLKEKGFKAKYIQPVDMFCHTPHIENVALLKKEN